MSARSEGRSGARGGEERGELVLKEPQTLRIELGLKAVRTTITSGEQIQENKECLRERISSW